MRLDEDLLIQWVSDADKLVDNYHDLVGEDSALLKQSNAVRSGSEIAEFAEKQREVGRLLQVAIIGRVKAGKSSLLNSLLFDGQEILPKAATPMTASLTTIGYGEKPGAKVEFFTTEDIANLRTLHGQYEAEFTRRLEEKLNAQQQRLGGATQPRQPVVATDAEKLRAVIKRELGLNAALDAAHNLYQRILDSRLDTSSLPPEKTLEANSINDLKSQLRDYVGADGKFMPLTKCLHMQLPQERLEGLLVVDTPGVNDPIASREMRTYEYLKECDVVLIVSPSGQFLNAQDIDLMDRITTREGVCEAYIVASQIDTQLLGSEKAKYDGRLPDVLAGLKRTLAGQAKQTIERLVQDSGINHGPLSKLVDESESRLIVASGICRTLLRQPENTWDENASHVWGNLQKHYPDYFSDHQMARQHLETMTGDSAIQDVLKAVRINKDQIIADRLRPFLEGQHSAIDAYLRALGSAVKQNRERLQVADFATVRQQLEQLKEISNEGTRVVKPIFDGLVEELSTNLPRNLKEEVKDAYKKSKRDIKDAESEVSDIQRHEKSGALNWLAKKLWDGGYEERTEMVTAVHAGVVRDTLEEFRDDLEHALVTMVADFVKQWRGTLQKQVISSMRSVVGEGVVDSDLIQRACIKAVSVIKDLPEPKLPGLPKPLKSRSGRLKGSDAEDCLEAARNYLEQLKTDAEEVIKKIQGRMQDIAAMDFAESIFSAYESDIHELEKQIKTKGLTLERFDALLRDLNKMTIQNG